MSADPVVMEHFPALLDRAETEAAVGRIRAHFRERGYGLWAVEVPGVTAFAGFVGLKTPALPAPFEPETEVGWRLAPPYWGHGYATEGARAAVQYAFEVLQLPALVSLTVPANERSQAVMRRLGFTHDPKDDFDHPALPAGHRLLRHRRYRLSADAWRAQAQRR